MANDGKWTLRYGIHNGTFTSRDSTSVPGLDSLEACRKEIRETEQYYRNMGYVIWWAQANGPNGEKVTVHGGNTNYNNPKSFSEMERERASRQRFNPLDDDDPYGKRRKKR